MDRACSRHKGEEGGMQGSSEKEDLDVGGRIILKWILER
jgi:hypothetical protein